MTLSAVLVLAACSTSADTGVQWESYPAERRGQIDAASEAGDCQLLQDLFDAADASNDSMREAVGHNNAKLMRYLDDAMRAAGCY